MFEGDLYGGYVMIMLNCFKLFVVVLVMVVGIGFLLNVFVYVKGL